MNIPAVLAAFKTALADLDADVYDFMPDAPTVPCVCIYMESMPLDPTADVVFVLLCLAGTVDMQNSQDRLMGWLSDDGDQSIIGMIDADNMLGDTVGSVIPLEVRNWGLQPVQEGRPRLLQAELVCNVLR